MSSNHRTRCCPRAWLICLWAAFYDVLLLRFRRQPRITRLVKDHVIHAGAKKESKPSSTSLGNYDDQEDDLIDGKGKGQGKELLARHQKEKDYSRPKPKETSVEPAKGPADANGHSVTPSQPSPSRAAPRIGLSISVHPPKFHFLARFLSQYARCPAAWSAFSVHVVFSAKKDLQKWRHGLKSLKSQDIVASFAHPEVDELLRVVQDMKQDTASSSSATREKLVLGKDPTSSLDATATTSTSTTKKSNVQSTANSHSRPHPWRAVIADVPTQLHSPDTDVQGYTGWKKWYGLLHMLDLPPDERPDFGAMLDADMLINFDACKNGIKNEHRGADVVNKGADDQASLEKARPEKAFPATKNPKQDEEHGSSGVVSAEDAAATKDLKYKDQSRQEKTTARWGNEESAFSYFLERVQQNERSRRFPAAAVSSDIEIYNLTKTNSWNGQTYNRALMFRSFPRAIEAANGATRIRRWRYLLSKRDLVPRDFGDRRFFRYRWHNDHVSIIDRYDKGIDRGVDKSRSALVAVGRESVLGRPPKTITTTKKTRGEENIIGTRRGMGQCPLPIAGPEMLSAAQHLQTVLRDVLFSWWADFPVVNLTHIVPAFVTGLALERRVVGLSDLDSASPVSDPPTTTDDIKDTTCPKQRTPREDFEGLLSHRYARNSILPLSKHDNTLWERRNRATLLRNAGVCERSSRTRAEVEAAEKKDHAVDHAMQKQSERDPKQVGVSEDSSNADVDEQKVVAQENVDALCKLLGVRPTTPWKQGSNNKTQQTNAPDSLGATATTTSKIISPFSYRALGRHLEHTNFEMMLYHYFAILVFGYRIRDVTNITGKAPWGSYMESPQLLRGPTAKKNNVVNEKGKRIGLNDVLPPDLRRNCADGSLYREDVLSLSGGKNATTTSTEAQRPIGVTLSGNPTTTSTEAQRPIEQGSGTSKQPGDCVIFDDQLVSIREGAPLRKLNPLWVSDEAARRAEAGQLPAFSKEKRHMPLFVFHADHDQSRWGDARKQQWERFLAGFHE
ncbi:unnamed protein product [Amoebophrya sp. A25]|nr:unnamed protein product [Amoebophrya sp. A25]|eukprot:GSA25T00009461001.1